MKYNWQQKEWPEFSYDLLEVEDALYTFAQQVGRISGALKAMPEDTQVETLINTMVAEAIKSSEIEGEHLNREDVVSSIRRNLGLDKTTKQVKDKKAKGAAELMIKVRNGYADKLTQKMLFEWHSILMQHTPNIIIGNWRDSEEPMQLVSGAYGREKVHFEAPPAKAVPHEMKGFIEWFNATAPKEAKEIKYAPVRAAIAHLYFETIHPFEDGNGRIGRAIAEKALSQTVGRPILLSLSAVIEAHKKDYYSALETAQRSNEITPWLVYFIDTILKAQDRAELLIDFTLNKAKFFDRYKDKLNERQLKAVKRMLDEGPDGFEGGMNAKKYMSITQTSKPTATRDLQNLLELGAFTVIGGGRSTRYYLNLKT